LSISAILYYFFSFKSPDYENRVAFIETFHKDFKNIVDAYSGDNKIYTLMCMKMLLPSFSISSMNYRRLKDGGITLHRRPNART